MTIYLYTALPVSPRLSVESYLYQMHAVICRVVYASEDFPASHLLAAQRVGTPHQIRSRKAMPTGHAPGLGAVEMFHAFHGLRHQEREDQYSYLRKPEIRYLFWSRVSGTDQACL